LRSYLGTTNQVEEPYSKADGSCQWIDTRQDFQQWRDPTHEIIETADALNTRYGISLFWVYANPGTGKTFLAAHVAAELAQDHVEYVSYFFHDGHKTSRSLGDFLRSVAFQMALANASARESLIALYENGSLFDQDDVQAIWNKIFLKGIFQVSQLGQWFIASNSLL
jgi:hypothetical protein